MRNHKTFLCLTSAIAAMAVPAVLHAADVPAATSPAPTAAAGGEQDDTNAIIVTGTRLTGLRVKDSPAPIQVLGSDVLRHVGQPNLIQALNQIVPSFTAEGFGSDTANLTLAARLRGLSPNQTLILVNGKRRHGSANLHVDPGAFQGSASPDLDLIPPSAIDHIEILQDGAAAQYGSDAIAGVINIILKSDAHGGTASFTGGSYYKGGGDTFSETARIALPIGQNGYFDLTAFHRFHDFSQQGGADTRLVNPNGTTVAGTPAAVQSASGFPYLNRVLGDARSFLTTGVYNAGYDFGDVEAYSFGTYSRRVAQSRASYRLPSAVTRTAGGTTTTFAPGGFTPAEGLKEDDFSVTGGIRGKVSGWNWDLSGTYGKDKDRLSTVNSANASLYADTGFTPTTFQDGALIAGQFTGNLDINRQVEIGLAKPLNIAAGGEYRRDTYEIQSGDAGSLYKEGGQGYPGFPTVDAGKHARHAWSGYIDLSVNPLEAWTIDLAGRYEDYSDFGSTEIGKLTTRYDFSPAFAVRGTVSTGFRAPTLAEEYYSAVIVSQRLFIAQIPPNSAPAALIGFKPLKPEESTNFSAGFISHPVPAITVSIDAYQVSVRNRIVASGTILGRSGATVVNPAVLAAIAANGNTPDPAVGLVAAMVFNNGINTRTRGVEFAADYTSHLEFGRIDWSLTANYNKTVITENGLGSALYGLNAQSNLTTGSPRYKIGLGALFTSGPFTANLRETLYGPTSVYLTPNAATFYPTRIGLSPITDLELGYKITKGLELSVGANNLLNKKPPKIPLIPGSTNAFVSGTALYDQPLLYSPYGINGGYYYGRVTLNF